ncbi:lysophospholipid acyltransferase family protein [Rhodovulum sp. DZ06]|uniref:lysophospholipid acyltransferase family protein n=1 Tax=Rhodovulum sp. DZ06 TaxID=3425126 RepID=UPI003D35601E
MSGEEHVPPPHLSGVDDPELHGGLPDGEGAAQRAARDGEPPEAPGETPAPRRTRGADETWDGAEYLELPRPEAWRIALAVPRALLAALATLVCLVPFLPLKWLEGRFPALRRPRLAVAMAWSRLICACIGLRIRRTGRPMPHGGALVANHSSWTDIVVLLGAAPVTFVSKAAVAGWPAIGFLAKAAGTMFIERKRSHAKRQQEEMQARIEAGEQLLFFPEATSSDALRVLPFKSTLFAVFFTEELKDRTWVQPVSVVYRPKPGGGRPKAFYGWWGDMGFGAHALVLLTRSFGGVAEVVFHEPVRAKDFKGRKELTAHCDALVRAGVESRLGPPPAEVFKD